MLSKSRLKLLNAIDKCSDIDSLPGNLAKIKPDPSAWDEADGKDGPGSCGRALPKAA